MRIEKVMGKEYKVFKYIIRKQKHYWILYLESEDRNWMVLKELPIESGIKILAIPVKSIVGTSELWDEGEYWLDFQEDNKITFDIIKEDNKLKGVYCLITYNKDWILFKRHLRHWEIEMQNEKEQNEIEQNEIEISKKEGY